MKEGDKEIHNTVTLQAGLRTLHEAGPELKRAISGNLDELVDDNPEPMHRVSFTKIDLYIPPLTSRCETRYANFFFYIPTETVNVAIFLIFVVNRPLLFNWYRCY